MPAGRTVSIVIPVYNGSDFVREAIDSALAQTYPDVEVIVVNDGSNDGGRTEDAARSYGDRIRYFQKPNGGVASALNRGIAEMSGDYFAWLSHDDLFTPEKIAVQMEYAAREGDGVVLYSDYEFIDARSRRLRAVRMRQVAAADFLLYLMRESSLHGCTLLIPRDCFRAAGTFDETLTTSQDYDLWFRMAGHCRFLHIPRILVKSRLHPGQTSHAVRPLHMKETNEWLVRCLKSLECPEGSARKTLDGGLCYSLAVNWKSRGFAAASEIAYASYVRSAQARGPWPGLLRTLRRWNYLACDRRYHPAYLFRVMTDIFSAKIAPKIRALGRFE